MIQFRHMKLARWLFTVMAALQFCMAAYPLIFLLRNGMFFWTGMTSDPEVLVTYLGLSALPAFSGLFLTVLALCTWVESWTLTPTTLRHSGLFRNRRIELDEVVKLRWWPINRVIIVYGSGTRIPIFIDAVPRPLRAELIEQLHRTVPEDRQTGWDFFERRAYQPLLNKLAQEQQAGSTDSAE